MIGLTAEQPASVHRKRKFWLKLGLLIGLPVSLGLVVWQQLSWRPREFRFGQVLTCVAFAPHGGKIAFVSVPNAAHVTTLAPINADVTPNSSSRVSLFALEQGIVRPLKRSILYAKPVTALHYSADGTLLATATERWFTENWLPPIGFGSSTIELWDARAGTLLRTLKHPGTVDAFDCDPHSDLLASRYTLPTFDNRTAKSGVIIWQTTTGKKISSFLLPDEGVSAIAFSPRTHLVATATRYGKKVKLWDSKSGKFVRAITPANQNLYPSRNFAFAPDGSHLAVSDGRQVSVYATGTGDLLYALEAPSPIKPGVAFSPDGKLMAVTGEHTLICEAATGHVVRMLPIASLGVAFSFDRGTLATIDGFSAKGESFENQSALRLWRMK